MSTTKKRTERRLDQAGLKESEAGVVFRGPSDGRMELSVGDAIIIAYDVLRILRLRRDEADE